MADEQDVTRAVRAALAIAGADGCVVCGAAADVTAIFEPYDSRAFGGAAGRQRLIAYSLCAGCARATTPEQVEDHLAQRLGLAA